MNKNLSIKGLYGIVDTTFTAPGEIETVARGLIKGGVGILQLRAKDLGSGALLDAAKRLRELTKGAGVVFIINDRVDAALLACADGVHLGQSDIPVSEARRLLGREKIIGLSTHSMEEALAAGLQDTDYISLGPVFPTSTKSNASPPVGTELIRRVKERVEKPVVAIGGITGERLEEVLRAGADSVAMISEILLSKDVEKRTRSLVKKIETFSKRCSTGTPVA